MKYLEQERDDGVDSVIHYFIDSNGSRGHVSYYRSNFASLERVVSLSGYPHKAAGRVFNEILIRAGEKSVPVEVIHYPLDNSVRGIILPAQSAGIIHYDLWDSDMSSGMALMFPGHAEKAREQMAEATSLFSQALKIHDDWEKIYVENMDFNAADELARKTIDRLIGGQQLEKQGSEIHRFFGAATVRGNVDYIGNITAAIPKRYFIKGRPGTGKSTFLKKIAAAAIEKGFRAEIYHCSFDPQSLDLVALRELGVCLFDSTAPHEYFPSRENDEIIDIYQEAVKPGTDETYAAELSAIKTAYGENVSAAVSFLSQAQKEVEALEHGLPEVDTAALEKESARLAADLLK